ncbi:diguanylate cyclase [Ketobacter sp.]|uniref:sensor domain-containing diguanylate cyclase n=1 Tax=Ketobacter sp. TaxID=2083498 RepID=UPI000F198049|nr:diguanylate cyclase [Ketobacter sp.]RLT92308.1 MAG: GGDEF domain-containing protein [Ketobacter sp.]
MNWKLLLVVLWAVPQFAFALNVIKVDGGEDGRQTTGQAEIWHDVENNHNVAEVERRYQQGAFAPLQTAGSTGLKPGAFWSHFLLHNVTEQPLTLELEYVDHQLVALETFVRPGAGGEQYQAIANLSLSDPFDLRPVPHNRFVVPVVIPAGQSVEFMVKFSSHQAGFVFPSLRIWTPERLRENYTRETSVIMFLFGGIFIMSIMSLVEAVATRDKTFLLYSVYALSKIVSWCTILGYTHQFLLKDHFHWNYLSISGALGVFFGIVFAREFLQTRRYAPLVDYVLLFMLGNAVFLLVCAIFNFNKLAVLSITVALLLYPMMSVAGVVRWRQGSADAGVFALAWSLLVFGLVVQALRDLGVVPHSTLNYYWPAFASFVEMLGIMAAMGIRVRRLRLQKNAVKKRYRNHLEESRKALEEQVRLRTRELEMAKLEAEHEARTDPLTGVYNRRSFFIEAGKRLHLALRKQQPMSLLMFDIDFFKSINDTFGHRLGDEALRLFSDTVVANLRDSDVWGRLGGEEFALVLNEDRDGTRRTAQRLREAIGNIGINTSAGELRMTASIGVAYLGQEEDIDMLLNKADDALYRAKHQGRDQIIEYEAGI